MKSPALRNALAAFAPFASLTLPIFAPTESRKNYTNPVPRSGTLSTSATKSKNPNSTFRGYAGSLKQKTSQSDANYIRHITKGIKFVGVNDEFQDKILESLEKKLIEAKERSPLIKDVLDFLHNNDVQIEFSSKIRADRPQSLGVFEPEENKITLYQINQILLNDNICKQKNSELSNLDNICSTFIHESAHLMQINGFDTFEESHALLNYLSPKMIFEEIDEFCSKAYPDPLSYKEAAPIKKSLLSLKDNLTNNGYKEHEMPYEIHAFMIEFEFLNPGALKECLPRTHNKLSNIHEEFHAQTKKELSLINYDFYQRGSISR